MLIPKNSEPTRAIQDVVGMRSWRSNCGVLRVSAGFFSFYACIYIYIAVQRTNAGLSVFLWTCNSVRSVFLWTCSSVFLWTERVYCHPNIMYTFFFMPSYLRLQSERLCMFMCTLICIYAIACVYIYVYMLLYLNVANYQRCLQIEPLTKNYHLCVTQTVTKCHELFHLQLPRRRYIYIRIQILRVCIFVCALLYLTLLHVTVSYRTVTNSQGCLQSEPLMVSIGADKRSSRAFSWRSAD